MSFTYQELQDAIAAQMNGADDADFTANVPVFIRQAEERIFKSVQLLIFRETAAPTVTASTATVTTATDFLAALSFAVQVSGGWVFLEQKDLTFVQSYWPDATATGVPRYYALASQAAGGAATLQLAPTPAGSYTSQLQYLKRPASITAGAASATTWLSVNADDALLYGALFEAAIFQKSEEDTLTLFNSRFTDALSRLKNLGEAQQPVDNFRHGLQRVPRT